MNAQQKWDAFYSLSKRKQFLHFSKEQIEKILETFPSAKTALDIGCGEGELMEILEQKGFTVQGIDISPVALKNARKRTSGVLRQGDFEKEVFNQGMVFDYIFIKLILAFIKNYPEFFRKVDSLLSANGVVVILTPVISRAKQNTDEEEIFTEQVVLDEFLPKYFKNVNESILYQEIDKRLSLYICRR